MAQRYQRKTKNYFINQNLQGRIILAVFIAALLSCIIFMVLFGLFSSDSMTIAYKNNELQMGETPFMLLKNAMAANWTFILLVGSLLVLVAIIGTHRIAGPLFRFEKALDNMNRRNLADTIYLRGKDEGKELASKINTFNQQLSDDLSSLQKNMGEMKELIDQFDTLNLTPDSQASNKMATLRQALQGTCEKVHNIVSSYRLING